MPRKLNILITNASQIYGGGEFFVYNLARRLKDIHNVFVSCRKDNKLRDLCGESGISVLETPYPDVRANLKGIVSVLGGYIEEHKIDIVHTNDNFDRTAGSYAAKIKNIKSVTSVHVAHSIKHNISHALRNRFLISHFIADGYTVRDILVNRDMIDPEKITVVFNGIDPDEYSADKIPRREFRNRYNIGNDTVLIGNVARLVSFKGQDLLIKAFAVLCGVTDKTKLLIAGDGELEHELRSLAAKLGVRDRVIFAGFIDDLRSAYSAFDVYAHTSRSGGGEAFPFAVLKALAAGLPVVASDVADLPVMVQDGFNGYITDGEKTDVTAEKLRILVNGEEIRKKMGANSRLLLNRNFSDKLMADKINSIYLGLMSRNG